MRLDTQKIRLTAERPYAEVHALGRLAAQQGVSVTEALRRAIGTEHLLQQRRNHGCKVLLEKNGLLSEIIFE